MNRFKTIQKGKLFLCFCVLFLETVLQLPAQIKTTSPGVQTYNTVYRKQFTKDNVVTTNYAANSPMCSGTFIHTADQGTYQYDMVTYMEIDNSSIGLKNSDIDHVEIRLDVWVYNQQIDSKTPPLNKPAVADIYLFGDDRYIPGMTIQSLYTNFTNLNNRASIGSISTSNTDAISESLYITITESDLEQLSLNVPSRTDFSLGILPNNSSVIRVEVGNITIHYRCPNPDVPDETNFLTTVASSASISVSNYATPGASSYKIKDCATGATYTTSATSYTITGLQTNSTHSFQIMATNNCGSSAYSSCSSPVKISIPTIPPQPQASENTPFKINVNEYKVPGASSYTIADCQSGQTYTVSATANSYDVPVTAGSTHSYKVFATNAVGNSAYSPCSNPVTTTSIPAVPPKPTTTATVETGNSTKTTITGYAVSGATSYTLIDCITNISYTAPSGTYVITGLAVGTKHSFKARATNAAGSSAYSVCSNEVTEPSIPPPLKPTSLQISAVNAITIYVNWDFSQNAEGYILKDCNTGEQYYLSGISTTFKYFTVPSNSLSHQYAVMAFNASGGSDFTACCSAITTPIPSVLSVPTGLSGFGVSTSSINLTWNKVAGANYYYIYDCNGTQVGSCSDPYYYYAINGLNTSSLYSYKVRAYNTNNGSISDFTTCYNVNTLSYTPDCKGYSYANDKFLLKQGNQPSNLNGVPSLCLGAVEWWIYPNLIDCHVYQRNLPLSNSKKLWVTVWECNYDLSHKSNYIEGEVLINRATSNKVDFFNLKGNLPGNNTSFFKADGVYDVWFWLYNGSTVTDAGNRFFHAWTDNGEIKDQPAYSVNLRAYDISIENSTIQNNYSSQFTQYETIDLLAKNKIIISNSVLKAGTACRISADALDCDHLQNGYRPTKDTDTQTEVKEEVNEEDDAKRTTDQLLVYPNPNNGNFTIDLSSRTSDISINNVLGQIVYQQKITGKATINLSDLRKGIYFVKSIDTNGKIEITKITIE